MIDGTQDMIPKFRAWHKELKKMYGVEILEFFPEGFGGLRICFAVAGNDYYDEFNSAQIELMQCIGLTDASGADIYEGDIIIDDFWKHKGCIYFGEHETNMDCGVAIAYGFYIKFENGNLRAINSWPLVMKVIGNVYEHPELLEIK